MFSFSKNIETKSPSPNTTKSVGMNVKNFVPWGNHFFRYTRYGLGEIAPIYWRKGNLERSTSTLLIRIYTQRSSSCWLGVGGLNIKWKFPNMRKVAMPVNDLNQVRSIKQHDVFPYLHFSIQRQSILSAHPCGSNRKQVYYGDGWAPDWMVDYNFYDERDSKNCNRNREERDHSQRLPCPHCNFRQCTLLLGRNIIEHDEIIWNSMQTCSLLFKHVQRRRRTFDGNTQKICSPTFDGWKYLLGGSIT